MQVADLRDVSEQKQEGQTLVDYRYLVVRAARSFISSGISSLELMKQGYQSLRMALENFDDSRGVSFENYASWMIKQSLFELVSGKSMQDGI